MQEAWCPKALPAMGHPTNPWIVVFTQADAHAGVGLDGCVQDYPDIHDIAVEIAAHLTVDAETEHSNTGLRNYRARARPTGTA